MKVVLLAGGFGSRISEDSIFRLKPMIEIWGLPSLVAYYDVGHNIVRVCS